MDDTAREPETIAERRHGPGRQPASIRQIAGLTQAQLTDHDGAARLLPPLLAQLDPLTAAWARTTAAAYIAAATLSTEQADAGPAWVTADQTLRHATDGTHAGLVGAAQYQVACALLRGDDRLAVLHLLEGERVAAQASSRNEAARSLVGQLLARERSGATPGLRALAARADVVW